VLSPGNLPNLEHLRNVVKRAQEYSRFGAPVLVWHTQVQSWLLDDAWCFSSVSKKLFCENMSVASATSGHGMSMLM
jgi:hypothetical protein